MDITIHDTDGDYETHVLNVPAETEEEACKLVAKQYGYEFGICGGNLEHEISPYFGIDKSCYKIQEDFETAMQYALEDGDTSIVRGLYLLYERQDQIREYSDIELYLNSLKRPTD